MKYLITLLFPSKALQQQKRYLRRGVYKPHDIKKHDSIWSIDDIVDYLDNFPLFGNDQCLLEDKILDIVEFLIPIDWQKGPLI